MDILYVASFASSTWLYRREVSDEWTWKAGWQFSALKQCRDFYMVLVWAGGNQPVPCWGWLEDGARCWTDKISRAEYCRDFYKKYGVFKYMNGWGAWKWGYGHGKNLFSQIQFSVHRDLFLWAGNRIMRTGVGKASVTCLKVEGSETPKEFSKLTGLTDWA